MSYLYLVKVAVAVYKGYKMFSSSSTSFKQSGKVVLAASVVGQTVTELSSGNSLLFHSPLAKVCFFDFRDLEQEWQLLFFVGLWLYQMYLKIIINYIFIKNRVSWSLQKKKASQSKMWVKQRLVDFGIILKMPGARTVVKWWKNSILSFRVTGIKYFTARAII